MSYFKIFPSSYSISRDQLNIKLNLLSFQKTIFTWTRSRQILLLWSVSLDFESPKAKLKLIPPNTAPNWTVIGLEYFGWDVERN